MLSTGSASESWISSADKRAHQTPIIDYIILAEFDIDTGSTVRHQFPGAIPGYAADFFAEYMLPEGAHNRVEDWTYILLNRGGSQIDESYWLSPRGSEAGVDAGASHMLFGINHVRTKYDSNVRRGAIVKAMAFFSKYHFVECFKDVLVQGLEMYYKNPSVDVLAMIYGTLRGIRMSEFPVLNTSEQIFLRNRCLRSRLNAIDRGEYRSLPPPEMLPVLDIAVVLCNPGPKSADGDSTTNEIASSYLSLPLSRSPDEVGDINVSRLLKLFGESSTRIFNAILSNQRVLFVGYNHPASDLAQMVFSAVAMCAPPVSSLIRRAVPYATLSDLSFLQIPGFIAGVTNPMFQQHDSWFDLLCILDIPNERGTVQSSEERRAEEAQLKGKPYQASPASTQELAMDALDSKFLSRVLSGIQCGFGEEWVRYQFHEYTLGFLQESLDLKYNKGLQGFEKLSDKYHKKYEQRYNRVAAIVNLPEFNRVPLHPWAWLKRDTNSVYVDGPRLRRDIRRLQLEVDLPSDIVLSSFEHLEHTMVSEHAIQALLYLLSETSGGISVLSNALFHPNEKIRERAENIFSKMREFESTRYVFENMNPFYLIAFHNNGILKR